MTINFATTKAAIKRHLSIIGKRIYTKEGTNLFSNITVSSVEDAIFEQYIQAAAQNVEAMLRQLVTFYSVISGTQIEITLENKRGDVNFDTRCGELINSYVVLFSVGEYLSMTHPELAAKYAKDAEGAIHALFSYAFYKGGPTHESAKKEYPLVLVDEEHDTFGFIVPPSDIMPSFFGNTTITISTATNGSGINVYGANDGVLQQNYFISAGTTPFELTDAEKRGFLNNYIDNNTDAFVFVPTSSNTGGLMYVTIEEPQTSAIDFTDPTGTVTT